MIEKPTQVEVDALFAKLKRDAENGGYRLNTDEELVKNIAAGLLVNEKRYGFKSCPCRLSDGNIETDRDIICPCDYRDRDVQEWGACYCGLYVSEEVYAGKKESTSIPERRPPLKERLKKNSSGAFALGANKLKYPIHRCNVCGYLCARETPPEICPICKAKKDRFERFL